MDLEQIKKRAEAATPGPWDRAWYMAQGDTSCPCGERGKLLHSYPSGDDRFRTYHIHEGSRFEDDHAITSLATFDEVAGNFDYEEGGIIRREDAEFIAHAREDVPALVAEVERLRALLAGRDG